jgi:hypothetical protein
VTSALRRALGAQTGAIAKEENHGALPAAR